MKGINVCGFIRGDLGLGQSARNCALALEAAEIPFTLVDSPNILEDGRETDETWTHRITTDNPYPINLIHINPDTLHLFYRDKRSKFFQGKKNIGYWHWELPQLPDAWKKYINPTKKGLVLDEVWCPTEFVANTVRKATSIPVRVVSHCIDLPQEYRMFSRLGLHRIEPKGAAHCFTFLCMFDGRSTRQRKNPDAVIEAFKLASASWDDEAQLIIKTHGLSTRDKDELFDLIDGYPHIQLLDELWDRTAIYKLEVSCDAFVSLHRSEGFGFCLAECMYLGKPCIATNWSGNMDFMNQTNSCLVAAPLVTLEDSYVMYQQGNTWAEPDVEEAARYMKSLVEKPEMCTRIGRQAAEDMRKYHSPKVIGDKFKEATRILNPHTKEDVDGP